MVDEFREKLISYWPGPEGFISVRDSYKLLYQAFHGAEHFVTNGTDATKWFWDEWENVQPDDKLAIFTELTIPSVTPPSYRVHFAPYKNAGFDPHDLLNEFLRTAGEFPTWFPTENEILHDNFIIAWGIVGEHIEEHLPRPIFDDYIEFTEMVSSKYWPNVSHSDRYKGQYNPHYRLVMDLAQILH